MKIATSRPLLLAAVVALIAATIPAFGQVEIHNKTPGYGGGQLLEFTYTQNFVCVDQPTSDLNFNKVHADRDPAEMQIPICQVGNEPTINPPGKKGSAENTTAPIYVLVPMFSTDNDQNPDDAISCNKVVPGTTCGAALGKTLISLFGAVPEAFKAKPDVYTQCPEPGAAPGTCTMHASRLDLGPALAALGLVKGPVQNIFVPTPNHSHVLKAADVKLPAIWWQVIPVLVLNQKDWPDKDGSSGITSVTAIRAAIKAGTAIEAPSNFFLFFSSAVNGGMAGHQM